MSQDTPTQMGSGTLPYTLAILHTSLGGAFGGTLASNAGQGRGIRTGANVTVCNPEDIVSVPTIRASGITVGTTPVNILNQMSHDAILKRGRMAEIINLGPGNVAIGGTPNVTLGLAGESGFFLIAPTAGQVPPQSVKLPIMNGCDVWAVASAASDVRILLY